MKGTLDGSLILSCVAVLERPQVESLELPASRSQSSALLSSPEPPSRPAPLGRARAHYAVIYPPPVLAGIRGPPSVEGMSSLMSLL